MGKTEIVQPSPPSAPSAGQSAADYAKALPQILQAQLQYQPQFDQQAFDTFQQLSPQYAQVSRDVLEQFSPNLARLDEELSKQALDLSQNGLSQSARDLYRNQFKALAGNQVSSGIGADYVGSNLVLANEQAKLQGQNLGLALQGKVPISQAYQPQSSFQVANSFQPAFATDVGGFSSVYSGAGRALGYETGAQKFAQYAGGAGGLLQGVGALTASSAILKQDISVIEDALEIIKEIIPVNYRWKHNKENDGGVIAEQLEEVIPDAVVDVDGIKSVKPMMLIGYMMRAIQELNEKIEKINGDSNG